MRTILALLLILLESVCLAQNISTPVITVNGRPVANRRVTLTYLDPGPFTASTNMVAGDFIGQNTDTNGMTVFSNVLAGVYSIDIAGAPSRSFPYLLITNFVGTLPATCFIVQPTNSVTGDNTSYTANAANARFMLKPTNAPVNGYVPTATGTGGNSAWMVGGSGVTNGSSPTFNTLTSTNAARLQSIFTGGIYDSSDDSQVINISERQLFDPQGHETLDFAGRALYDGVSVLNWANGININTNVTVTGAAVISGNGSGLTNLSMPLAVTNNDTRALVFTNYVSTGRTNTDTPSNFGTGPQRSVSNIISGVQYTAMQAGGAFLSGPFTVFPDGGGIMDGAGQEIQFQNNAHGTGTAGQGIRIVSGGTIGLLSGQYIQLGWSLHTGEIILHQYDDTLGFGAFTPGYNPYSKRDVWETQAGGFTMQAFGTLDTNQFYRAGLAFFSGDDTSATGGGEAGHSRLVKFIGSNFDYTVSGQMGRVTNYNVGVTYVMDFNGARFSDVIETGSTVALSTTNHGAVLPFPASVTPHDPKIFQISARGGQFTVTYPLWRTNINETLPTTIYAGQTLRLELESFGLGETNINVVSAKVMYDQTFAWDTDALDFISRAAITSPSQKSAANYLMVNAKAHNWATNFSAAGFFYVHINGETNNFFNNAVKGWVGHGTYTANTAGFTGNGSDGYYDTRLNPSSAGFNANNIAYYAYAKTNNSVVSTTTPMGNEGTTGYGKVYYTTGGGLQFWDARGPDSSAGTLISSGSSLSLTDFNILSERTNSTTISLWSGAINRSVAVSSSATENGFAYVGANNFSSGSPAGFYAGTICVSGGGAGFISSTIILNMFADITAFNALLGR